MGITLKNFILAVRDQGPFKRAFRNFVITRNAWGLFHINSHIRQDTKQPKVVYNTKESAAKAAHSLGKKMNKHFSYYKCMYCDGYHLGKNRDNKGELPKETPSNNLIYFFNPKKFLFLGFFCTFAQIQ